MSPAVTAHHADGRPVDTRALLNEGTARLAAAGFEHARHEAEWLLAGVLGMGRLTLYVEGSPVPPERAARFREGIAARAAGTPLQYVLGTAAFCGETLTVRPGVFIPRPETEAVALAAIEALERLAGSAQRPLRILDAGTGSGCLALALARALPTCRVVGVEVSWEALSVAARNVRDAGHAARVRLVQGRWLEALPGPWDGIVSNPPYVPTAQVERLPLDVRQEPAGSLNGGADGTHALRELLGQAAETLQAGGILALECDPGQVAGLEALAGSTGWVAATKRIHDLSGGVRGLVVTRRGGHG